MTDSQNNLITSKKLLKIATLGELPGAAGGIAGKWLVQVFHVDFANNTTLRLAFALAGLIGGIFGCCAWIIETRGK